MSSKTTKKGKIGVQLVVLELLKRGIDAISMPYFWPFDIITKLGLKLEVKYSNIGKRKGGTGYYSESFTFRVSKTETYIVDYLILVLNTKKGNLFYVIPMGEVTSRTIAFNPFSQVKSRYEKYRDYWNPIIEKHEEFLSRQKKGIKNHISYFTRFDVNRKKGVV